MTFRRVFSEILEEVMSQTRLPPPPTIYSPEERPRPRLQPEAMVTPPGAEERPRSTPRPEIIPNEEQLRVARLKPVRVSPALAPKQPRGMRRAEIVAALSSQAGVRQALVLHEILGPPKSLKPWNEDQTA